MLKLGMALIMFLATSASAGGGRKAACSKDSDCTKPLHCTPDKVCDSYGGGADAETESCLYVEPRMICTGAVHAEVIVPSSRKPGKWAAAGFPCASDEACEKFAEELRAGTPHEFVCKKGTIRAAGKDDKPHLADYGDGPWCFRQKGGPARTGPGLQLPKLEANYSADAGLRLTYQTSATKGFLSVRVECKLKGVTKKLAMDWPPGVQVRTVALEVSPTDTTTPLKIKQEPEWCQFNLIYRPEEESPEEEVPPACWRGKGAVVRNKKCQ